MISFCRHSIHKFILPLVMVATVSCCSAVQAADQITFVDDEQLIQRAPVGAFSATINKVNHLRKGAASPIDAQIGSDVEIKDLVTTLERSRAQVTFVDKTELRIASSSQVEITKFMFDNSKLKDGSLKILRGTLRSIVHHDISETPHFEVVTPTAVAAARGTDFFTIVKGLSTRFVCHDGMVEIRNINAGVAGTEMCAAGQTVDVTEGNPPTTPTATDPEVLEQLLEATEMTPAAPIESAPAQGAGAVEVAAAEVTTISATTTALGAAALGAVAIGAVASSNTPAGAIPAPTGTVTVEDSVYVMQQWNVAASPLGAASGPDANHVVTVTRDAGGNITSVTIAGTHNVPGGTNNGPFSYTFNTPVAANEFALGGAATDTPAALGAGPNSVILNQIEGLPIVAYQYVSLFHWGVQLNLDDWLAGTGVTGTLTPLASIPTAGTGTYTGIAQGWIYSTAALLDHDFRFNSTLNVTADFGTNQITNFATTGTITNANLGGGTYGANVANPNYDLNMVPAAPGTITGNTFTVGVVNVGSGFTGTANGAFFGPATKAPATGGANVPANIGGAFTASQATGPVGRMHGVFVGQ
ncbi:hypothetical protein F3F96_04460 [Mariprofundus sp. NF]|uniref:FecR domain-containing protein n=1 Tax=Mariprofundus sp. NF TaxID=2608716 RepID=UPI0015A361EC|nr:FecR domain-containing protein [Mariprofundus sp. NF]NWF38380.1 hypothetical protein [Mariprofundus sp. NF]